MLKLLYIFSYTIIIMFSTIFVWHKLLDRKINLKYYKLYVSLFGMTITSIINFLVISKFLKILIVTILLIIFFKYLFNEKINKCIITPIYTQIITFISEFLYAIILSLILGGEAEKIINSSLGTFVTNIIIAFMIYSSIKFKFIKSLYLKLLSITDRINSIQLGLFSVMGMLILNILLMGSYYRIKFHYFLTFNVATIILVLVVIFYSFRTQNKYNKVSDKYNVAIKSLKDYEDMMTKYRIANHENKNLLMTVRAMILNKDKDIPKYIDSIIEEKYVDDEKLLFEMSVIPSGGLRATIYSEILKIREHKINYSLNIDRKIKTIDLINLETETIVEICKIIGVFIDNSIEAVKRLKKKNIDIELYMENKNLCIKVSNNYKGNIDISKINDEGYTTKGKGHGYGLSLVKYIINNNNIFENKTEISKTIFSQILVIKLNKKIK